VRRRLIVGNWKMHKTATEAAVLVRRLSDLVSEPGQVEVVIAPPFTALHAAARALPASPSFALAAQNLYWEDEGPFTGEISAPMLKDLGCRYVILGHSERRQLFGEDDEGIKRKVRASLRHGLRPGSPDSSGRASTESQRMRSAWSPSPTSRCGPSGPAKPPRPPRRGRSTRRFGVPSPRVGALGPASRSGFCTGAV